MSSVHNSVETVNAAATAIVTAESRVQPPTVQKKRFTGSCLNIYSCFGTHKQTKKIGHAVLSEPSTSRTIPLISENRTHSSTSSSITIPFIAPPSSPASFLQSDPPSATNSPGGLLSISAHSPNGPGPASIFAIGPYAHEAQLVSPPVFSTFTTEPSTANFTPPPEPVQMTTPSSPEVPLAQLLSSSLDRNQRNNRSHVNMNLNFPLSQYEFQPYGNPGSEVAFPDRRAILEFRMAEAPKFLSYENRKWESRAGSGSLTPNENSEVTKSGNNDMGDQRVSFELFGEEFEIPTCVVRTPSGLNKKEDSFKEDLNGESWSEEESHKKHHTISFGSSKDFNFGNGAKGEVSEKSSVDCEWWTNEESVKELGTPSSWSFFPMLQSGASIDKGK